MLILLQKHKVTGIKVVTDNWPNAKLQKASSPMYILGQKTSL